MVFWEPNFFYTHFILIFITFHYLFFFFLQIQKIIFYYYYPFIVKWCQTNFFQMRSNEVLSWPDLRLGFTLSGECECQAGDLEIYIFSTSIINPFPYSVIYSFVNYEGTMNWARMIHLMLQSSMTVVGLKTLKLLVAQPAFMSLMTKTDVISHSY